jgi:Tfp pilus assembly protein PilX
MSVSVSSRQSTSRQAGMVSIMVTMILMVVLSLIVIGFAQIARRNSRQSLDRQLSTSAFYAAEAGVNDVRDLITK